MSPQQDEPAPANPPPPSVDPPSVDPPPAPGPAGPVPAPPANPWWAAQEAHRAAERQRRSEQRHPAGPPGGPAPPGAPAPPAGGPAQPHTPPSPAGGPVPPAGGPVPPHGAPRPGRPGRQRVRRRRQIMLVAAALGVAVAGTSVAAAVAFNDEDEPVRERPAPTTAAPPPAWAKDAGRLLTAGKGLRYDGAMTVNGRPVQASLRVSPAGLATGRLTAGALTADVVAVGGVTYLRADQRFWTAYAGDVPNPGYYAGRWSKAPASMPGFDVPRALGPKAIAKALAKASGTSAETVQGVPAHKIRTPGAEYLVAQAAPHRLLEVRAAGPHGPRFTVSPVTAPAAMFAELRPRVAQLGGAGDPALRFRPGTLAFHDCDRNTNGCAVRLPVTLTAPAGTVPDGARAALRASITSRGRSLGSCRASAPVPAARSLVLSCTVAGRQWRTWMRNALDNPGSYPYAATARVVGEAVDAAKVPGLLAKVDRERRRLLEPPPEPSASAEPPAGGSQPPGIATSRSPGAP